GADDLIYVHEGVAGFVTVRIADFWKAPVVQDQLKKLPPEAKKELDEKLKELEAKDQKPEDWARATVIVRSTDIRSMDFAISWKANKRIDRKKLLDEIGRQGNRKPKEINHEGMTLYVFEERG